MRNLFFTLAFLLPFLVQAQEVKTDSLPTTFDEVVVTADMVNRYALTIRIVSSPCRTSNSSLRQFRVYSD